MMPRVAGFHGYERQFLNGASMAIRCRAETLRGPLDAIVRQQVTV